MFTPVSLGEQRLIDRQKNQKMELRDNIENAMRDEREEKTVIEAAQRGDLGAFHRLVQNYQRRVLATAYRLVGDREAAKDVGQEVFVRVFRYIPHFNTRGKFFTWLYRIIVNVAWDHLRQQHRYHTTALDEIAATEPTLIQSSPAAADDTLEVLYMLVEHLSTVQKTTFILREVEEFSCKEIAVILGCPEGTVRSYLFHAKRILRDLITKRYPEFLEGVVHENLSQ